MFSSDLTNEVIKVAKCFGVPVEAEIGELLRLDEAGVQMENKNVANPEQVRQFLDLCQPDSLAIGIGNAHGYYKGEPDIKLEVLEEVRKFTDIPFVLHLPFFSLSQFLLYFRQLKLNTLK